MICTELIERFGWGSRGVWLYSHPCGVGDAGEPTQRCNPPNGIAIHR